VSDRPSCARCGAGVEDLPYLSDLCHDCYAAQWDKGFEASSQIAEALFGDGEDAAPQAGPPDPPEPTD
jgi:hypothetical protein